MEFKVIQFKTTTLHSGVVMQKNKFMHYEEQDIKEWQLSFISINNSNVNITKKIGV